MLFNKVAGHFKNFFLKLKIGKKDEILSKYHLVARHFKIVSTFYNIRYFKGEYFCLCLCQNLEFASAPPPSFPTVLVRGHLCKCTSDVEIVSLFTTSFTKNYGSRPLLACLVFLVHRILMHKENKDLIFNTAVTPKQSTVTAVLKFPFYFMGQFITKNIASSWRNHFILVKIGRNRIYLSSLLN